MYTQWLLLFKSLKIKKIAKSPNDIHSLKREQHVIRAYWNFYFGTICITIVTTSTLFCQSDQMRCQNVGNWIVFKILTNVVQYELQYLSHHQNTKWWVTFCEQCLCRMYVEYILLSCFHSRRISQSLSKKQKNFMFKTYGELSLILLFIALLWLLDFKHL